MEAKEKLKLLRILRGTFIFLPVFVILLSSCYPLTVTTRKWRIRWDKDMKKGKESFVVSSKPEVMDRPPNIIILLADDLGKYEVSAYGVDHISTPHIDQIGLEGVIFEDAYVTAPTCAPSRAGIMTGRVQNRYGFETQIMEFYPTNMVEYLSGKYFVETGSFVLEAKPHFPSEYQVQKQGVPPTEINLAEALKTLNYTNGLVGKWHLGISRKHVPLNRGFDYQYGFYGASSLYTAERNWSHIINHEHQSFSGQHQWNTGRYGEAAILEMGKEIREEEYLTYAFRDKAMTFLENNKDHPFFLYCTFSAPHVPFQAPVDYYCMYKHVEDENKRVYYAMISALDDAIGAIHQKVKDLGIEDNTIIYLLSDNGGATYTKATDNGPLKGGKLNQFEGGIQVPFMMKWPARIPAGIRYEYPVSSADIFVTSFINAGGKLPQDREYDGVNLIPFVLGENKDRPHENLFWRADHIWAVRDGDYKLILSTRDGWAELYDLSTDKSESYNLKEQMPDLYEKLYLLHQQWQEDNLPEKPMWPRIMDKRFIIDGKEYLFPA
jgi:arylsulfatase A-like enzyme